MLSIGAPVGRFNIRRKWFFFSHLHWAGDLNTDCLQWNSARIIALLTLMSVLIVAFIAIQILLPKTAMIPPRIFKIRSIWAGVLEMAFIGAGMYIFSKTP